MRNYLFWLLVISVIIGRYYQTRPVYQNGNMVKISGPVLSDPVNFTSSQYLKFGGLKIYLPKFPVVHYGDFLVIEGKVEGNKLTNPKILSLTGEKVFGSRLRNGIISFYQKVLPEPEAGLLAGITLGAKGALDNDFYDRAKITGVAHVVVASGTNIVFITGFLLSIGTIFVSRKKTMYIVILGSILYLFLAGFDAPLIRAFIMSGAVFTGQLAGRIINKWKVYFLASALMLIYSPDWIFDTGFLLSFAATGSLMLFEDKIARKLKKVPEFIRQSLSVSLAAQIGVAPILLVAFGRFNILSPIINVLTIWIVPMVMILGALGGLAGLIWEPMGKIFLYLSYPLLWWFTHVVSVFAGK